jgi:hypothetical protein
VVNFRHPAAFPKTKVPYFRLIGGWIHPRVGINDVKKTPVPVWNGSTVPLSSSQPYQGFSMLFVQVLKNTGQRAVLLLVSVNKIQNPSVIPD